MQNPSCKDEFDLHKNKPVGEAHFLMNGFARRLVLEQRQKATRKCPIEFYLQPYLNFELFGL